MLAPKQLPRSSCSPKSLKAEKLLQLRTAGCLRLERGQRYPVLDQLMGIGPHGLWWLLPLKGGEGQSFVVRQTAAPTWVHLFSSSGTSSCRPLRAGNTTEGGLALVKLTSLWRTISDVKTNNRHSQTVGECCERQGDSESDGGLFSAGWKGKRWQR